MSRFRRNKAPGWASSSEEGEESSEVESSGSDVETEKQQAMPKRTRPNDHEPFQGKPLNRKINNIWGDVLADQQLASGVSATVNVMAGDECVARGSETYDCTKAAGNDAGDSAPKDARMKEKVGAASGEGMGNVEEEDDDPFHDSYVEGPDLMMAAASTEAARQSTTNTIRKRPWQRGAHRRQTRGDERMDEDGDTKKPVDTVAQRGGRGRGFGQWRGHPNRGRGRGRQYPDGNSRSGSRVKVEKISLNKDDAPNAIGLAIAGSLHEPKSELMIKTTEVIGAEKAIQLYYATVDIENSGGKMTLDGRRRRTAGGVFLYLVREDQEISEEQKNEIFGADREEYRKQLKAKRRIQQAKDEGGGAKEKMETVEGERPLKDAKDLFLEETLRERKEITGRLENVKTGDVSMESQ